MAAGSQLFSDFAIDNIYGVLDRLPDPDLVLQSLGYTRADLRRLETDDEISGAMDTHRDAVIGTPWHLSPYEESQHKWLWDAIAPHIEDLLIGAWKAIPYGYSVVETVLKKTKPMITIDHLGVKPMQWFEPRPDGRLLMTLPNSTVYREEVPTDGKYILTRRLATYEQPFGESLLSRCYWPWFFRHNGWEFWMKFLNRFADPLLLGQVGDPALFIQEMQKLGYRFVIGTGIDEKVSAVTPDARDAFKVVEDALLSRIQKTWLGQTLTTQMGVRGNSGAAAVHNEVRKDRRDSALKLVRPAGQTLVNLLWRVNDMPGQAPTFLLQDGKGLDMDRADRDAKLVTAGILTFTEDYIVNQYDLEPGDFVVGPAPSATPDIPPAPGDKTGLKAKFGAPDPKHLRKGQRFSADQQLVEDLADAAVLGAPQPIPVELIRAAISKSTSPEDLTDRLAALYTGHDPVEFREWTERALFAADVLGYVTAEKRIGVS
jgi:phage gp29-like protein